MRSKKVICAVIAAAMATSMAFASCESSSSTAGGSNSSSAANSSENSTTAATTEQKAAKDMQAIADKLKDSLDEAVKATMTPFDESRIEKMIGVKKDLYNKAVCIVDGSGGSAHEIDCFEAKDESTAKEIETALKARIDTQKKNFENYVPAEMDKLNNPVLVVDGNYVFMCLSNNNDKAKEIIG